MATLKTIHKGLWGGSIKVEGKAYEVSDEGLCEIDNPDHAKLQMAFPGWGPGQKRVAPVKQAVPAPKQEAPKTEAKSAEAIPPPKVGKKK